MKEKMEEFWNERYSNKTFAYGEQPNLFFKKELDKLKKGKILLPADGEGRNSVYAAKNDWETYSCDLSEEGKRKAEQLANKHEVTLKYSVGDFGMLEYENDFFDAVALIFAHFPSDKKSEYHKLLDKYIKPNGYILFEAFSKNHIKFNSSNPKVGGPKDIDMLFSIEELAKDFSNYEFISLTEDEIVLNEGEYHIGKGSVVRFVAKKMRLNLE